MLSPNTFFLMLLPPIIFEAGYNLHKVCFKLDCIDLQMYFALLTTRINFFYLFYRTIKKTIKTQLCVYITIQGNFFQNFGSILLFAVFGTLISAMVVGGGIYLMGVAGIAYNLTLTDR